MEKKPIWASKTFWFNAVGGIASIAAAFGLDIDAETKAVLVGGIMAVVNIVLRFVTKEPVSLTGE